MVVYTHSNTRGHDRRRCTTSYKRTPRGRAAGRVERSLVGGVRVWTIAPLELEKHRYEILHSPNVRTPHHHNSVTPRYETGTGSNETMQ